MRSMCTGLIDERHGNAPGTYLVGQAAIGDAVGQVAIDTGLQGKPRGFAKIGGDLVEGRKLLDRGIVRDDGAVETPIPREVSP